MMLQKVIKTGKRRIPCAGDSIWGTRREPVTISRITVEAEDDCDPKRPYVLVWVDHNAEWEIYTDRGFEKGISKLMSEKLGFAVNISFTEQGMQENGRASMEYGTYETGRKLFKWLKEK